MQAINSSNTSVSANSNLKVSPQLQAQQQRARTAVRDDNQTQQAKSGTEAQQRFEVDQQAIALIEQEQFQPESNRQNAAEQNNANSRYDAPSRENQSAVAAYQSVDTLAKRDNIQQIFGVDLFA